MARLSWKLPVGARNWRSGTGYPDPTSTSNSQWAWEFLRRNPTYKAAYQHHLAVVGALMTKYAVPDYEQAYDAAEARDDPDFPFSIFHFQKKWGCEAPWPPNPADPIPWPLLHWSNSATAVRFPVDEISSGRQHGHDSPRRSVEFDLTRPLEPQFKAAARYLKSKERSLVIAGKIEPLAIKRARRNEYPHYLRILDVIAELRVEIGSVPNGVLVEIGALLFPNQPNPEPDCPRNDLVRKMIQAARKMRDHGYRDLPALPNAKSGK